MKLVDLQPQTAAEVKSVLQGALLTVKNEDAEAIAKTISQF